MVSLVKEFKDITGKAMLVAELKTIADMLVYLNDKKTEVEQKLVKLDMEVAKNGLERKETSLDK